MNHVTVGVYSNGEYVINVVDEKDLNGHVNYNKSMRFGRAFFVDGNCVNYGYLSDQMINEWTFKIKEMKIDSSKLSDVYR